MVRAMLTLVILGHGYLTAQSWLTHGYQGFFPPFAQANTTQIFSDLVISVSLLHFAIAADIQKREESALWNLPLLLGTSLCGSFSPLLYFFWRPTFLEHTIAGFFQQAPSVQQASPANGNNPPSE